MQKKRLVKLVYFFFFSITNDEAIKAPTISPIDTAHQIPISPINKGKRYKNPIWNINVLIREIRRDKAPLFKAVKKEEKKIEKPQAR